MLTNLKIENMRIEMILCPLCNKPICSTVGFDCHKECISNNSNCLQRKYNHKTCKCLRISLNNFFRENYVFDKVYNLKQMIKLVSARYVQKIFLPEELFEI